jgi:formate C-acetyltransferase
MAAGAPIDLRLNKRGLEGAEGTNRISALIKTFIQQGGNMITLTVTDADELRRAIAEPEKYRSLRVRMGGWTAYFVSLSKEAQAIQLRRSEHGF